MPFRTCRPPFCNSNILCQNLHNAVTIWILAYQGANVNSIEVSFLARSVLTYERRGKLNALQGGMITVGQAINKRIHELCDERGITVNKLATLSGITQSTLSNITGGRNNSTTVATIKKICDGLNITLKDFFDSTVFDDLEQEIR